MNDHDKDLISAYLDNETTAEESKYVESLMESNAEVLNYANQLKSANVEINQYFEGDEFKELETLVDKFLLTKIGKKPKNRESIFNFNINKILNPYSFSGYALTALIVFSLNTDFYPSAQSFYDEPIDSPGFSKTLNFFHDFSSDRIFLKKEKPRGNESFKNILKEVLNTMIESKSLNANLSFGSQTFVIQLMQEIPVSNQIKCLEGMITEKDKNDSFVYCVSDSETSLILNEN